MGNLYNEGWRQGSIFEATLQAPVSEVRADRIESVSRDYSVWIVCTQDCDLAGADADASEPIIELRPVLSDDPPTDWGIRSRRLRLSVREYVDAALPRCLIAPNALVLASQTRPRALELGRATAFKTWLGRRYDRPAIPDDLVDLARDIAKRCGTKSNRDAAEGVHDVLMQFMTADDPPQAALFAVVHDDADPEAVRAWLGDAASRVRKDLGVIAAIDVGTRSETPLSLIETSYSADLSQLTWSGEEPHGAT